MGDKQPAREGEPPHPRPLPARVLVTGATGFIGGALARSLAADGVSVRGIGRNLEVGLALQAAGIDYRPVDLTQRAAVIRACRDVDVVVHAGALAAPWAARGEFEAVNLGGTQHVVEGCLQHGVRRLVYVSTPAVQSRFQSQRGLKETDPVPQRFVSDYARTKHAGELVVREASDRLDTVIIRPKAVYGPGDNAVFPRVLAAARAGRLPRIGDGETVTNLTWIDDVVSALRAALTSAKAVGGTYTIAGHQDVRIWDVIDDLLHRLGVPLPHRALSVGAAMRMATALEAAWRVKGTGEPPLSRYSVGVLAYSQTYDIGAARRDLEWAPRVGIDEGVRRFVAHLAGAESSASLPVLEVPARRPLEPSSWGLEPIALTVRSAGTCKVPGAVFLPDAARTRIDVPALFGHLEHPREGTILFDTGYAPRFLDATQGFPHRLYRWATPPTISDETSAVGQLRAAGVAPEQVRWILLSHFDPDHYGGLMDFPEARIVVTQTAWASARDKHGLEALRARLLPGHLPDDLAARLLLVPAFDGPGIGPFGASHDLFGDQTLVLVDLPGHSPGQFGLFVKRAEDDRIVFLAADGCWNCASLDRTPVWGRVHRLLAVDKEAQEATYERLARLRRDWPEVLLAPSHCPEAAQLLGA